VSTVTAQAGATATGGGPPLSDLPIERSVDRLPGDRGETKIAPGVVSTIAARAALDVPGVMRSEPSGLARVLRRPEGGLPGASADVEGDHAHIELKVTFTYPVPVWSTADSVRQIVRQRVKSYTGLDVGEIDLEITGFTQPQGRKARVE